MNSTIWLALALVLVLEGLGPMLYPKAWKKMISAMTNLPDNILRRFGGGLVVAGVPVIYLAAAGLVAIALLLTWRLKKRPPVEIPEAASSS